MKKFTQPCLSWLENILYERFGVNILLNHDCEEYLYLTIDGYEGSIIFDTLLSEFQQSSANFDCSVWNAENEGFRTVISAELPAPALVSLKTPLVENHQNNVIIHYDILGLTYWMLCRLEEVDAKDVDKHDRFPAVSSHAFKHNYLERPIVDEWLDILGQVIELKWPGIQLKQKNFRVKVSHDVDTPSLYGFKPWHRLFKIMASHILKRRDLKAFFLTPYIKLLTSNSLCKNDPYNTFDWLMDESDRNNITSAFYFICGKTHARYDADYELDNPIIRELIRKIHSRGHEIGLHPSYNTYKNHHLFMKEAQNLKAICRKEGVEQTQWGGRMHYLRWKHPTTLYGWEKSAMTYDSTLGYADRPGFRCGTCFEFFAFDPVKQKALSLRIRPLIVMECTVVDEQYLGLGSTNEAMLKMVELKERCKAVEGTFSILWHNSFFTRENAREIYQKVISS